MESSVAGRVLADSTVAVSVSVRERTFVSDTSTVVLIARSIDGDTGCLREEESEESGSLELVTALAASERAVSAVTRSDTVGVRANVSDRSAVVDIGLQVERGTDTVDVVVSRLAAGEFAHS